MDYFEIEGGTPLHGTITPAGNKNAAFPLIAAALLTDQPVTLRNLPDIGDIRTMLTVVEQLGLTITRHDPNTVTLHTHDIEHTRPDPKLFAQLRGALVLMGPLLARAGKVQMPRPGGDQIGRRRIDTHILALQALGAQPSYSERSLYLTTPPGGLTGADILLDEASVTGTENAVLAAVLANGHTTLRNAASEPHVQQLCHLLNQMGAQIHGIGSNTLEIDGVTTLSGGDITLDSDYLEVVSYIGAAVVTGGSIRITNAGHHHLRMPRLVFERLGVTWHEDGPDLIVPAEQSREIIPDLDGHFPTVADGPWPAFPADMMSVAITIATTLHGSVLFHEKMFESRMFFVDKLVGMGARIILCDPHRCLVQGPNQLYAERLESPDIRAGMALMLAALGAQGRSTISNIRQVERGYENVEHKLRQLGARITRHTTGQETPR